MDRHSLFGPLPALADDADSAVAPTLRRTLGSLAVGVGGGAVFAFAGAPLAWMLGALITVTVASLAGARLTIPVRLRTLMVAVLGVMLGAAFTPEIGGQIAAWGGAVLVMLGFLVASMALVVVFLRFGLGIDRATAYFSAAPGGITEMVLAGEAHGADSRVITLMHATRILVIVAVIPFYFRVLEGIDVPTLPPDAESLLQTPLFDGLLMAACALLGYWIARPLRIPAAALVGPMLLSAAVHMAGWTAASPPVELLAAAQVVVGTALGARFAGLTLRSVWPYLLVGAGSAVIMMVLAWFAAALFAEALDIDRTGLLLALVPGGLVEMGLIALSLDVDTAMVSTLHVLRIAAIMLVAPIAFTIIDRYMLRRHTGPGPR
ncbi:MAG: AbrB family transcriptional regulator [Thioalkalivibrio sp.]|nr:MAG: AbrB family transcriptional regulator [Thioalkalivibrio sp.]